MLEDLLEISVPKKGKMIFIRLLRIAESPLQSS
jgi:hypothetical protein